LGDNASLTFYGTSFLRDIFGTEQDTPWPSMVSSNAEITDCEGDTSNMVNRRGLLICALLVGAIISGCARVTHNIVGTWDIKGGPGPATFSFTADGNFKTEATMPGRKSSVNGQYRLDGDTLTLRTMQTRTATLKWSSDDDAVMTGDDGKAMEIVRRK